MTRRPRIVLRMGGISKVGGRGVPDELHNVTATGQRNAWKRNQIPFNPPFSKGETSEGIRAALFQPYEKRTPVSPLEKGGLRGI
jgi:hypothetical protein